MVKFSSPQKKKENSQIHMAQQYNFTILQGGKNLHRHSLI